MTVSEMITALDLKLDKSSSFETTAFETEDKLFWLNESQIEIVKRKVFGNNYRREALFQGTKHLQDIQTLFKEVDTGSTYITGHSFYNNVQYISLTSGVIDSSTPYMFYIDSSVKFGTNTDITNCVYINKDEAKPLLETDTNKPYLQYVYCYLSDNNLNFIKDPYADSITHLHLTYIRKPKTLVTGTPGATETNTSEIAEEAHNEIVDLAVFMMLENIESTRLQSNQLMVNNNE